MNKLKEQKLKTKINTIDMKLKFIERLIELAEKAANECLIFKSRVSLSGLKTRRARLNMKKINLTVMLEFMNKGVK